MNTWRVLFCVMGDNGSISHDSEIKMNVFRFLWQARRMFKQLYHNAWYIPKATNTLWQHPLRLEAGTIYAKCIMVWFNLQHPHGAFLIGCFFLRLSLLSNPIQSNPYLEGVKWLFLCIRLLPLTSKSLPFRSPRNNLSRQNDHNIARWQDSPWHRNDVSFHFEIFTAIICHPSCKDASTKWASGWKKRSIARYNTL